MAKRVHVAFRLTPEFDSYVRARATEFNISRTAVIRVLLAVALATEDSRAQVQRRLTALGRATAEGEGI